MLKFISVQGQVKFLSQLKNYPLDNFIYPGPVAYRIQIFFFLKSLYYYPPLVKSGPISVNIKLLTSKTIYYLSYNILHTKSEQYFPNIRSLQS